MIKYMFYVAWILSALATRVVAAEAKKASEPAPATKGVDEDTTTKFDFDEATLDGKMKSPSGMMLKGRVQQNKNQLVQLRKEFRADLRKSSSAVQAIKARD